MKAISVRAPWWWYILHSSKNIENRDRSTNFRGVVLIHASKWYVHRDVVDDVCDANQMAEASGGRVMTDHPYETVRPLGGCIVGSVEIVDCVSRSDSPWFVGRYGFVLRHPIIYRTPVPFRGELGFFDVPDGILMGQ